MVRLALFVLLPFISTLIFSECSFGANYYAENEHQLSEYKDSELNILAMDTITKVPNEDICHKIAKLKSKSFGKWVSSGSLCVKGTDMIPGVSSTDETMSYLFNDEPRERGMYVAFTDLNGFQTRFYFQILAGPQYPIPGFPSDLPNKVTVPLANVFINSLEKTGVRDARIIFPLSSD